MTLHEFMLTCGPGKFTPGFVHFNPDTKSVEVFWEDGPYFHERVSAEVDIIRAADKPGRRIIGVKIHNIVELIRKKIQLFDERLEAVKKFVEGEKSEFGEYEPYQCPEEE